MTVGELIAELAQMDPSSICYVDQDVVLKSATERDGACLLSEMPQHCMPCRGSGEITKTCSCAGLNGGRECMKCENTGGIETPCGDCKGTGNYCG